MATDKTFVDPTVVGSRVIPMAIRPESLSGKVVGLYDNTKEQADVILESIGERLLEKYGVKELFTRKGIHYSKPAPVGTIEEMADACDVVVCALGG